MDERLEDMEIRYAFLEQQLSALDAVVREVADQVAQVAGELKAIRAQLATREGPSGSLEDEVPPHY